MSSSSLIQKKKNEEALSDLFEHRKKWFLHALSSAVENTTSDRFAKQMFQMENSMIYVPDRICEIVKQSIYDDRELYIDQLLNYISNNSESFNTDEIERLGGNLLKLSHEQIQKEFEHREKIKRLSMKPAPRNDKKFLLDVMNQLTVFNTTVLSLGQDLKKLKRRYSMFLEKLKIEVSNFLSKKLKESETVITDMRYENRRLQQRAQRLETLNTSDNLIQQQKEILNLREKAARDLSEIEQYKLQAHRQKRISDSYLSQIDELNGEIERIKMENLKLKTNLSKIQLESQNEMASSKMKNDSLISQLKEKNNEEINALKKENEGKLYKISQRYQNLKEKSENEKLELKRQYEYDISDLKKNINEIMLIKDQNESALIQIKQKNRIRISNLKEQIVKLKEQLEELQQKSRTYTEINGQKESEIIKLKHQYEDDITKLIKKKENEIQELKMKYKKQIQQLKLKNEQSNNEFQKKKNDEIEELRKQKELELSEIKQKHSKELSDLKQKSDSEIAKLRQKNADEISRIMQEKLNEISEIKSKHDLDITEIKERNEKELLDLKNRSEIEYNNLKQKSQNELNELKQQSASTINQLKQKNADLKKQNTEEINKILEKNEAEISQLKSQNENEILKIKEENNQMESLLSSSKEDVNAIKRENHAYKEKTKQYEEMIANLKAIIDNNDNNINKKYQNLIISQKMLKKLKDDFEKVSFVLTEIEKLDDSSIPGIQQLKKRIASSNLERELLEELKEKCFHLMLTKEDAANFENSNELLEQCTNLLLQDDVKQVLNKLEQKISVNSPNETVTRLFRQLNRKTKENQRLQIINQKLQNQNDDLLQQLGDIKMNIRTNSSAALSPSRVFSSPFNQSLSQNISQFSKISEDSSDDEDNYGDIIASPIMKNKNNGGFPSNINVFSGLSNLNTDYDEEFASSDDDRADSKDKVYLPTLTKVSKQNDEKSIHSESAGFSSRPNSSRQKVSFPQNPKMGKKDEEFTIIQTLMALFDLSSPDDIPLHFSKLKEQSEEYENFKNSLCEALKISNPEEIFVSIQKLRFENRKMKEREEKILSSFPNKIAPSQLQIEISKILRDQSQLKKILSSENFDTIEELISDFTTIKKINNDYIEREQSIIQIFQNYEFEKVPETISAIIKENKKYKAIENEILRVNNTLSLSQIPKYILQIKTNVSNMLEKFCKLVSPKADEDSFILSLSNIEELKTLLPPDEANDIRGFIERNMIFM